MSGNFFYIMASSVYIMISSMSFKDKAAVFIIVSPDSYIIHIYYTIINVFIENSRK